MERGKDAMSRVSLDRCETPNFPVGHKEQSGVAVT